MNTTEANEYLAKLKGQSETEEPITPEVKEDQDVTPQTGSDETKGVETKPEEKAADDKAPEQKEESKVEVSKKEPSKNESKKPEDKQSQRDYAFIRLKQKRKEEKERYEKRIKELEDELKKGNGLKAEHFVKEDGKPDTDGYVNWKLRERDMQQEIRQLQREEQERQMANYMEEDRRRVENCFKDEAARKEYDDLITKNGRAFLEAVNEVDKEGVVFNYLSTMPEYPLVLKELMTDPKLLGYTFRSTDPDTLKRNIAVVADQILDKYHKPDTAPKAEEPAPKKEIPIVGKQITASPAAETAVRGRSYWNNYLSQHPRG